MGKERRIKIKAVFVKQDKSMNYPFTENKEYKFEVLIYSPLKKISPEVYDFYTLDDFGKQVYLDQDQYNELFKRKKRLRLEKLKKVNGINEENNHERIRNAMKVAKKLDADVLRSNLKKGLKLEFNDMGTSCKYVEHPTGDLYIGNKYKQVLKYDREYGNVLNVKTRSDIGYVLSYMLNIPPY